MLYLSSPRLACFDGTAPAPAPEPEPKPKSFTQEEVNTLLAGDRRKHQAQVAQAQKALEETLASKNLTLHEREQLAQQLEEFQAASRTKEQQAAHEKKELEKTHVKQLGEEKKAREQWENRYREEHVARALQDAAATNDAFQPAQVVTLLRQWTRLVEVKDERTGRATGQFRTVVDFPDTDPETDLPTVVQHSPESAVRRMKELPAFYGNLFKSGVVSGLGSSGTVPGLSNGRLDLKNLTPAQYMEIRSKNPELLGLRKPRR